nr:UDP-N-acetylmuramoyl-tripeptide--D-alanyl-D-alanine ligase [Kitasatospora sp. MMS16-BH015]
MTLAQIAESVGGYLDHVTDTTTEVTAPAAFDSRHVTPGGLFACLAGNRADGHDFAGSAVADGAVAALAARPVGVPAIVVPDVLGALSSLAKAVHNRYDGTTVALTGSAGKTSTKDILRQILDCHGTTVATERSFNNEIGFPVTVLRVTADTRFLVLEMGARNRGHIRQLAETAPPQIGAVLGVGSAHLGEFGAREAIATAKRELVEALPGHGTAILNADDPLVLAMADHTPAGVLLFGRHADADVRAENVTVDASGRAAFTLTWQDKSAPVRLRIVGEHHLTNALAAAAIALTCGVPFHTTAGALSTATLLSGSRMEVTDRPDGITVINDAFNASPESVRAALASLAHLAAGGRPTVAVLGEMKELGAAAEAIHEQIGDLVAHHRISRLVAVGGPNAGLIAKAAQRGGVPAEHVADKSAVLPLIAPALTDRQIVLVKGSNSAALFDVAADLITAQ